MQKKKKETGNTKERWSHQAHKTQTHNGGKKGGNMAEQKERGGTETE